SGGGRLGAGRRGRAAPARPQRSPGVRRDPAGCDPRGAHAPRRAPPARRDPPARAGWAGDCTVRRGGGAALSGGCARVPPPPIPDRATLLPARSHRLSPPAPVATLVAPAKSRIFRFVPRTTALAWGLATLVLAVGSAHAEQPSTDK